MGRSEHDVGYTNQNPDPDHKNCESTGPITR